MFPHLPSSLHLDRIAITREQAGGAVAVAVALTGVALYLMLRKRISPEELELMRRTHLARVGRIIDGSIVGIDGSSEDTSADGVLDVPAEELAAPRVRQYRYRIAGVTYECAQEVAMLTDYVRNIRIDLPVQVRYDPRNPGNSIVVSEEWNGVQHDPYEPETPLPEYSPHEQI